MKLWWVKPAESLWIAHPDKAPNSLMMSRLVLQDNIFLRQELHTKLVFLNVSESAITNFLTLYDLENDFAKAASTLRQCIKQREAMAVLKKALRDLELVVQNARELGVDVRKNFWCSRRETEVEQYRSIS